MKAIEKKLISKCVLHYKNERNVFFYSVMLSLMQVSGHLDLILDECKENVD